jgi:FKBP-type peptidyl-prolyl cis-trans isomerase SlyD
MSPSRDLTVGPGRVVGVYFKAYDDQGQLLDSSDRLGHRPLVFLFGAGNVMPGLEELLEGRRKNDFVEGTLAPAQAYGEHQSKWIETVEREKIPVQGELAVGMRLDGFDPSGRRVSALVTRIEEGRVTLDRNHPMAGRSIRFEATVAGVREATPEEIEHGHPHGLGGHQH